MANGSTVRSEVGTSESCVRVLCFTVDDALFSLHLDWAEAVYAADAVSVHTVRSRRGGTRQFLIHRGEPAFCADLRELFGLDSVLGGTQRAIYVVVRSGSYRLALQVDAVVGIEELDLRTQAPVPSSLTRDGGVHVANLVQHDRGVMSILDPNRLLDGAMRDTLEPSLRAARAFVDRDGKIEALSEAICEKPVLADVRSYARLCKRNGRTRTAAAARTVLRFLEDAAATAESGSEKIVREMIQAAAQGQDGQVRCQIPDGSPGCIFLIAGRAVDAEYGGDYGARALKKLLEIRDLECRFEPGTQTDRGEQWTVSTVATLVDALEAVSGGRRGRRGP